MDTLLLKDDGTKPKSDELKELIDGINAENYNKFVLQAIDPNSAINQARADARNEYLVNKAFSQGKTLRQIASLSATEDALYSRHYGPEYYKDKKLLKRLGVTTVPDYEI